jgi:MtaA/CmuA family methyltransferase
MNSMERFRSRMRGELVDRPPNMDIMMMFAAHFIRQPLSRYYLDHRVLCDSNFAVQEAFALDLVQAISDPYREAADLGLPVDFPEDSLPIWRGPLIAGPDDVRRVRFTAPENGPRMSDRLAAVQLFRQRVGGQVPILGWVEGALAEAADLRGVATLLVDLMDRPAWLEDLLETLAQVEIAFARAQVRAGADIIGLGDAVGSQISPRMYRQFALPYEQRIISAIHEAGGLARLHICGNTSRILPDMLESGADIIDLDWMVDMREAASVFGDRAAICGNFDPVAVMLRATPEQVGRATVACLEQGGPRCISGAGCEIPDGTPHANLFAQAHALAHYGRDD